MNNRARLYSALEAAKLLPAQSRLPYLHALIRQRGEYERSRIIAEIGQTAWDSGIAQIAAADPERSAVWALGHGSLLAEFATSPAGFGDRIRIASLGARANFIVTAFDNLLDQGKRAEALLGPGFSPTAESPWLGLMVRGYFRLLGPRRTPLLESMIRKMYDAETRTDDWRRKNALPFVVLATGGASFAHRAWLYRAGLLLGYIDSFVDGDSRPGVAKQPDEIIRLVRRVLEWWDRHSKERDCREAFLYCLGTWTAPRIR